jgi:hypothetical protein
MDSQDHKTRASNAVQVLRKLNDIGAIRLDVLLSKSAEIKEIVAAGGGGASAALDDDWWQMCYPYMIHLGPHLEIDLVTVVAELRQLGFEVKQRS